MRLVDLETAKKLDKLGYDEEYRCVYLKEDDGDKYTLIAPSQYHRIKSEWDFVKAPRLDDVAYWLRKKYGFLIEISYFGFIRHNLRHGYYNIIHDLYKGESFHNKDRLFKRYDEALEYAIKTVIDNIINKKQ